MNQPIFTSNNSKNENSINDNYGEILSGKDFTNEHIDCKDPNRLYLIVKLL